MQDPIGHLKTIGIQLIENLESLKNLDSSSAYTFEIECDTLRDFSHEDIRGASEFKPIFEALEKIKSPVVYWFEIVSDIPRVKIKEQLKAYSETAGARSTPAMKENTNSDSAYLYVGKVKRHFFGRVIQHLGFYAQAQTQGLQLFHWAKGLGLVLKVHVVEFDNSMEDLVSIIELEMARKLQPIIGKHK